MNNTHDVPADFRLGVLLGSEMPPEEVICAARTAERCGADDVWIAEDYFFGAGFSTAAAILASTETVTIAIGVVSALVRHPAVTAMEIATLARMFPGRIRPSLGYGAPGWVDQMGLTHPAPVRAVRDRLRAVRSLLRGEEVSVSEPDFAMDAVVLTHPPREAPPILLGVSGPKMLRMAAAEADGTVLSLLAGPRYIEWVREVQAQPGVPPTPLTCFALAAVDEDSGRARSAARAAVAAMICRRPDSAMVLHAANYEAVASIIGRGKAYVSETLPDPCLDEFAIAGSASECVGGVRARLSAGVSSVVLCPVPTGDSAGSADRIGDLLTATKELRA